jgi:hypothetical protein
VWCGRYNSDVVEGVCKRSGARVALKVYALQEMGPIYRVQLLREIRLHMGLVRAEVGCDLRWRCGAAGACDTCDASGALCHTSIRQIPVSPDVRLGALQCSPNCWFPATADPSTAAPARCTQSHPGIVPMW